MNDPLSPSAVAVLDAANGCCSYGPDDVLNESRWIAAAALEAVADQVAPSDAMEPRNYIPMALECQRIRAELLAIAAELRAQ